MLELTKFEKAYYTEFINSNEQTGFLYYTYNKKTITLLSGQNTSGEPIEPETVEYDGEIQKVSPAGIFLLIAKILRKKLCPECRTIPK